MNEKQTEPPKVIRPTKKQRELLSFIERFIVEHGYGPSYREIMGGLNYTSVATVALHINNLIRRGHLKKREYSARSLELTNPTEEKPVTTNLVEASDERWLVEKVDHAFAQLEQTGELLHEKELDSLYVLLGALNVLGLVAAAQSFQPRLAALKKRAV
jgi:SOS-response transcriptional repressor LexA